MRDHPIPSVTEPFQYRAIGLVRAKYKPSDPQQFTRGRLIDAEGHELEAVVLGRVMTLMRRYLDMGKPHLWVVYPRCRELDHLHLQIAGIWEPITLEKNPEQSSKSQNSLDAPLPEGDDYFSIRGELIFTKPESHELVIKVRQRKKSDGSRPAPFKLKLKGEIPLTLLRRFLSLDMRRKDQTLYVESYEDIGTIPGKVNHQRRIPVSRSKAIDRVANSSS